MAASVLTMVENVLGSVTLSYEDLEERFGTEAMKKVLLRSGIRNRRVAAPGVCGSDLATDAATNLFARNDVDPSTVDFLIHCTQSPDYFLPTTACLIHERLGLRRDCGAFDLNLGCSQYVYALAVANSMIVSGLAKRVLVTTGDTMSHTVHPKDRALTPILGDAGSASVLDAAGEGEGFLAFDLGTDGSGARHLMIPAGGFRQPATAETAVAVEDAEGNVRSQQNLYMNGAAIFHFAITVVPKSVELVLAKASLSIDSVDLFLFHQANMYMLEYLLKKMKIPREKAHFHLEDVGNTSGSTLPSVLSDAVRAGKVKPGMTVLMIAFGVGLSWGATVMRVGAAGIR
jgi:3-oxoacyl-[acyl-carrier-protein] synthase-3